MTERVLKLHLLLNLLLLKLVHPLLRGKRVLPRNLTASMAGGKKSCPQDFGMLDSSGSSDESRPSLKDDSMYDSASEPDDSN